jgi:hypothetical protein
MDLLLLFVFVLLLFRNEIRSGIHLRHRGTLSSDRRALLPKPSPLELEASRAAQPHREPAP